MWAEPMMCNLVVTKRAKHAVLFIQKNLLMKSTKNILYKTHIKEEG
jgi:hypothetical protein